MSQVKALLQAYQRVMIYKLMLGVWLCFGLISISFGLMLYAFVYAHYSPIVIFSAFILVWGLIGVILYRVCCRALVRRRRAEMQLQKNQYVEMISLLAGLVVRYYQFRRHSSAKKEHV